MLDDFQCEKDYLDKTLVRFDEIIDMTKLKMNALPRLHGNNPYLLEKLMSQYSSKLELLKRTAGKPYFARLDFQNDEDQKVEQCYIGKVGVADEDNNIVTIDWRSPIASMYYDSNIGKASYLAPQGKISGELLIKRQYDIEDGVLNDYQDVDTVSNDEMLKPYLGVSADSRLKNIVATIQSEQNEIIRENISHNIIVQGVAGSGKTTVALHRIAYLVYNNLDNIDPNQYLVIGPNKFFVNYISGVLPDLDVKNVGQYTYEEILRQLLNDNFELLSDENKLITSIEEPEKLSFERFKVSLAFKDVIDKFLMDYEKTVIPKKDFEIRGYKILPSNIIKQIYDDIGNDTAMKYDILTKKVEKAILLIKKYIENHYDKILLDVNTTSFHKISTLSLEEKRKEQKNIEYVKKELKNFCHQSIKKYFSKAYPKIISLYIELLRNISNYILFDEFHFTKTHLEENMNRLKKRKIDFEDVGAMIYLYYRIYGSSVFEKYRHVVVDEAQDFGEFNFYALKKLMPNCSFSIFGDLAQSIYQYRGIRNWNEVINSTFYGNCEMKYLLKSYRTTTEIMNSANCITNYLDFKVAEPVIRHGLEVKYIKYHNNQIEMIENLINDYLKKKYSSIAIICKDKKESDDIYQELKNKDFNISHIDSSDTEYHSGICIITSYLAKGLEFDGVIISDADEEIYNSNKRIDMKLLYVAMTRPLHELNILYRNNINHALKSI